MAKKEKKLTYSIAFEELNEIQLAMENNEVSIDELSEKVKSQLPPSVLPREVEND